MTDLSDTPVVGEVWQIDPELGGWDDQARHINPPAVIILEVFSDIDGYRVAQVHTSKNLRENDVCIPHGYFVETWNTYAVPRSALFSRILWKVSDEIVKEIIEGEEIEPSSDTVWHFRQFEMECGAFIATKVMSELMEMHEQPKEKFHAKA